MAGNITPTVAAPFIPELWANTALEILRPLIVLCGLTTKDTDVASFQVGNTLHVPYTGTFTANDKTAGSPVTLQQPTATDTTVTLNKHKEVSFLVEDVTQAQANQSLREQYMKATVPALVNQLESDLFALYSGFSTTPLGTSGTDLTAATLRAARKQFVDNKVPQGDRHLVLSSKDVNSLMADTSLQSYFAFNDAERGDISQGLTNGQVAKPIYGLALHESQLVPVVTGTPNSTKNFAFDPGAIILAMRTLPEAPAGVGAVQATVKDPVSGIVLRVTMSYAANYLGVQVTVDILYGVAKLRDEKGFVVLS
ncbi:MAG: P22 phage major capsid protein family protein [Marmoricola sp.]|uniref:P22 phage major capsid protein family protein n=1 Tax=Humibacter sp. TaxID=1940291 RepID=UPI003F809F37